MAALSRKQREIQEREEQILTVARRMFVAEGYHGLSMERIAAEMRQLGFDEVRFDKMGNILGRIGHGPTVIVYDSHIDTVGIGDPDAWEWDPFEGKVEELIYLGDHVRTRVNVCGNDEFIVKIPNAQGHRLVEKGQNIQLGWLSDDCRALDPF